MRVHITCHGKKTTVSIDDLLIDYLGAWLVAEHPHLHSKAKKQHDYAIGYIKQYVEKKGEFFPEKNISQHIQAFIIRMIAAPGLADIIETRGSRYQKKQTDSETLAKWQAEMEAKKALKL